MSSYLHFWSVGNISSGDGAVCDIGTEAADGKIVIDTTGGKRFYCYDKKDGELKTIFRLTITVVSTGSSNVNNFSSGKGLLFRVNGGASIIAIEEGKSFCFEKFPVTSIEVLGDTGSFTAVGFYN